MRRLKTNSVVLIALGVTATSGCAGFGSLRADSGVRLDPAAFESPPPCPVDGGPVNFALRMRRPDGPVYFSHVACIERFEREPEAYSEMVEMQHEMLKTRPRIQVLCPITGNPVSSTVYTDLFGERVYFCDTCKACPELYEADPEGYQAALEAGYTYQTRCPVSGREIDPQVFFEPSDGPRVYFCSQRCRAWYRRAPERYAANLAAQGVDVHPQ